MNVVLPIRTLMTADVKAVAPTDDLTVVETLFDKNNIHHLPVVRHNEILGMVSKSDFLQFLHGFTNNDDTREKEIKRMQACRVEDIMTVKLAKVEASDPIRTALEVFKLNRFHALPVLEEGKLVGILTTYDIIKAIAEEPIELTDYSVKA